MTDRSDFCADPLTFMATNIVRPQFFDVMHGIMPSVSRPHVVTIAEINANARIVNKVGGKIYGFTTDVAGLGRDEKMPIYWLGYAQNATTEGMLSNTMQYMFTATMDGCTMGIGSQTGDGACRVAHSNNARAGSGGQREGQRSAQESDLRDTFGDDRFRMIQPSAYMLTSHGSFSFKATNFGINNGGRWSFYTLSWLSLNGLPSGNHIHGGVKVARPIPPVPVG